MKKAGISAKFIMGLGVAGMLLAGNWQRAAAMPRPQDKPVPESRVLDLAAEALGWPERTDGGISVSHTVKSGEIIIGSVIRWMIRPASLFVYSGNQPGDAFGETQGYPSGSSCTLAGGCNPPYTSRFFSFNFDMNLDGDNNLDTPAERYLSFHCEITITAPEAQLYAPIGEVAELCTIVYAKAVEVRTSLEIPACVGVVCPSSKCDGDTLRTGGSCDPKTGQCVYSSSEECGVIGCNIGTGKCNTPDRANLCEGVVCEPAYCEGEVSYSDPACDPEDGACYYFAKEECGGAGCNPETGLCHPAAPVVCGDATCAAAYCEDNVSYTEPACDPEDNACGYFAREDCGAAGCNLGTGTCNPSPPGPCGGTAALMLIPLALFMRRPKPKP